MYVVAVCYCCSIKKNVHCPLKIWTWMRSGGPLLDEPLVHPSLFCLFSLFNKHAASLKQQQQVGIIYYIHQIPN